MSKRILLYLLAPLWLFAAELCAQTTTPKSVPFVGQVYEAREEREPLGVPGAVVELYLPGDTLRTVTNSEGAFSLRKVPVGKAIIRLSHVAYEPLQEEVMVSSQFMLNLYTLRPRTVSLKEVQVAAKPPAFTMHGDTIVFHAAAFKTLLGDNAIELVKQLPGVKVSDDGTVTVSGKTVSKTYVDGKLLFGDDASTALNNLAAEEVVSISSYDQLSAVDRLSGNVTAGKERVFNIETKHKFPKVQRVKATVGAGKDFEGDRSRYLLSGSARSFSEQLSVMAEASLNNQGTSLDDESIPTDNDTSDNRESSVNLVLLRRFGNPEIGPNLRASGFVSRDKASDHSFSRRIYVPTEELQTHLYNDSTDTYRRTDTYGTGLYFTNWSDHLFSASLDFTYIRPTYESSRRTLTQMDNQQETSEVLNTTRSRNYKWSGSVNRSLYDSHRLKVKGALFGKFDKNTGEGTRLDTLSSTATTKIYQIGERGYQRDFSASLNLQFLLLDGSKKKPTSSGDKEETDASEDADEFESFEDDGPSATLDWNLSYERENDRQRNLRMELQENGTYALDSLMSEQYSRNYHHLKNSFDFRYSRGDHRLGISLGLDYARQGEDKQLYPARVLQKNFLLWSPQVTWNYGNMLQSINVVYDVQTSLPSLEQMNNRIDDANPLYLNSGNARLKPSYTHFFSASFYRMMKNNSSVDAGASVSLQTRQIASHTRFYANGGVLEDWNNYEMAAGTTFTTYENVNGGVSVNANAGYDTDLSPLRSTLRLGVNFNFSRDVGYVEEVLNHTYGQTYSLNLNLRSNFSRNYRVNLLTYSSLRKNYATVGDLANTFSQRVELTSENNFTDWLFFHLGGNYQTTKSYHGNHFSDHQWVLNSRVGVRLLKQRARISLSGFDLLNKSSHFSWTTTDNYQSEAWTTTHGRFWLLTFGYLFNSSASSR